MAKGHEATGTSTVGPALQAGSERWAGIRGAVNPVIEAVKDIPDAYKRNVRLQEKINDHLGSGTTKREKHVARHANPERNNTTRDKIIEIGKKIVTALGVGTVDEEYYAEHKAAEREISPAPPPTEDDLRRDAEWRAKQKELTSAEQISTLEQAPSAKQEQQTGEEVTLARLQTEIAALTNEKVQEINTAESATDAVFTKGMADIAVQSKIAHEVILPYSAEGIAQLETMRSDALATLQQALDTRNQGTKPTAAPSQELTQSVAHAAHTPVPVSTSEQTPQAPAGFEAQVSELTDRTAQEIMASGSAMDAIRMKGEAASAVLSMTAHELMQPYLSHEDAAQLKDTRDRALAALQAALDVRLESPDSNEATSVTAESQPLAEAAQAPEAAPAEQTHEAVDGSAEENRAADRKAATEVEKKKEGWWARRMQTVQEVGRKAMQAAARAKAWLNEQ